MKCKLCGCEVRKAKWFEFFLFAPLSFLWIGNCFVHKNKVFSDCKAILLNMKLVVE